MTWMEILVGVLVLVCDEIEEYLANYLIKELILEIVWCVADIWFNCRLLKLLDVVILAFV